MKSLFQFITRWFFGGFLFTMGAVVTLGILGLVLWFLPGNQPLEALFFPQTNATSGGTTGPTSGGMQPQIGAPLPPVATPGGELPSISIWMTRSSEPSGERVTQISRLEINQLHVWAQADKPGAVPFTIWMVSPMGTNQWGPEFITNDDGSPVSVGGFDEGSGMKTGTYRLVARIRDTSVGDFQFEVTQ